MSSSKSRTRRPFRLTLVAASVLAITGCGNEQTAPAHSSAAPATSFTETISVPMAPAEADRLLTIVPMADGRYYAAGFVTVNGDTHMTLARLAATGSLDPSFGQNGLATINVAVGGKTAELARGVVVQSNGKVVIAGPVEHDPTASGDAARDTDIALVRFDPTGHVDPTFGVNGIVRLDLSTGVLAGTTFRGDTVWDSPCSRTTPSSLLAESWRMGRAEQILTTPS